MRLRVPGRPERGRNLLRALPEVRGPEGERMRGLVSGGGKRWLLRLLCERGPQGPDLGRGKQALHEHVPGGESLGRGQVSVLRGYRCPEAALDGGGGLRELLRGESGNAGLGREVWLLRTLSCRGAELESFDENVRVRLSGRTPALEWDILHHLCARGSEARGKRELRGGVRLLGRGRGLWGVVMCG